MNLELANSTIKLSRIELQLSLNAVPSLSLFLKEERDAQTVKKIVGSKDKAKLQWQDNTLEVIPYGFENVPKSASENEAILHALLLEQDLETWFTTKPEAKAGLHYGIYQNQSEVGGWSFLNSCLGHQVLVPVNSYKDRIDSILPISTCLPRPIRQDNQQYLGTVIAYLQLHLPELVGWSAIHASQEALRFVFFDEENAVKLNESWENLSAKFPIRFTNNGRNQRTQYGQKTQLRKSGMQIKEDKKMALLMEIARHGIQEPLSGFLETNDEKDLLYLPGSVKLAEKLFLCEAITYRFEDDDDTLTTTLEVSSGLQTPASAAIPCRLEGLFKAWDADDDEEVRVFLSPPENSQWQLMDPLDSNLLKPDADLMAEFVLPTTPKDDYSEFYVRRVEGDRVVFKVEGFNTPIIYGSHQKLTEELEAATVSFNTEILALATSSRDTAINDMHGVIAKAKTIMYRTGDEVVAEASTITLAQNIQVKKDSLSIASKTDIASSASVDKVKVSGVPGMAIIPAANIHYPIDVRKMGVSGVPFSSLRTPGQGGPSKDQSSELSWISFSLVDEDGEVIVGKNYRMVLTNGDIVKGRTTSAGKVEAKNIPAGICHIIFFDIVEGVEESALLADVAKDWIEIELVDSKDKPIAGELYRITLPDGKEKEGKLDDNGFARLEDIAPGACQVVFPNLGGWEKID